MLNNIQKSTGPRRPIYKNYYISEYGLLNSYSNYRKIQPRDNIDRYSQRVCPLQF
jgi:hypothetical protein